MYTPDPDDLKRLDNDFNYHPPVPALHQAERYAMLRAEARAYATRLLTLCPRSRELSLALTHLEQAVMYAIAAIARNEDGKGPGRPTAPG